jgi:hypothetical protein
VEDERLKCLAEQIRRVEESEKKLGLQNRTEAATRWGLLKEGQARPVVQLSFGSWQLWTEVEDGKATMEQWNNGSNMKRTSLGEWPWLRGPEACPDISVANGISKCFCVFFSFMIFFLFLFS